MLGLKNVCIRFFNRLSFSYTIVYFQLPTKSKHIKKASRSFGLSKTICLGARIDLDF